MNNFPSPPPSDKIQKRAQYALQLQNKGHLEQARQLYLAILEECPEFASVSFNLGLSFYPDRATTGDAIRWFKQTLKHQPYHLKALMLLAESLYWNGEVEASLRLILKTLPDADAAHFKNWQPAEQHQLRQRQFMAESWLLKCLYALGDFDDSDFFMGLRAWGKSWADPLTPQPGPEVLEANPARTLRVGYFSQEFAGFSSGFLILPLLAAHDRQKFELIAFSDGPNDPVASQRYRTYFNTWHDVQSLSAAELADLIRAERIDILVDLAGHTHPERLLVFARKPAPVQITGLGFGTPVGILAMDGFISDPIIYPAAQTPILSEQVFYLDSAIHWQPPLKEIPLRIKSAEQPFVFGSANGLYKLDLPCLNTWAEILKRCPNALLWLKAAPLAGEASAQRIRDFFAESGVSPDRLILQGITPPGKHFEQFYNGIDLALDPFPYNGGVTSCDALWMGVPVLSLNARNRCGASILTRLSLTGWLAESVADYIEKACLAYTKPVRDLALKQALRQRLLASPICQMMNYAQQVENIYLKLWQNNLHPSADNKVG
ncbi:MAG: hypothetical protein AB7I41_24925 [Candidatus Sericytochromatia bacterium]